MKLGVFSDLHSNIYALDAMLVAGEDIQQWVSLGDNVGLFPPVNAVLDRIRTTPMRVVQGNHEAALMSGQALPHSISGTDALERQRVVISDENAAYVAGLPRTVSFELGGRRIHAVHALTETEGQTDAKYRLNLEQINATFIDFDILLFGDTHLPVLCHCRDLLLVNPGSCGFSIDVTRRPSFAVIETDDLSCELRRFGYDTTPLLDDISRAGYSPSLHRFVKTGMWGG